jgi:hypothetical protein
MSMNSDIMSTETLEIHTIRVLQFIGLNGDISPNMQSGFTSDPSEGFKRFFSDSL